MILEDVINHFKFWSLAITLKILPRISYYIFTVFVQAFVYAAVLDASNRRRAILPEPGVPDMLPLAICDPLTTPEQAKFWTSVYQLTHNINK